jgi:hypothetical protein
MWHNTVVTNQLPSASHTQKDILGGIMYAELMKRVHTLEAEFAWATAQCNDPYRLSHILTNHVKALDIILVEAEMLVSELEEA